MCTQTQNKLANAIRFLSIDAVQQANSGHPGAPMGMADIAEVLWRDYLQHNPADPCWPNRDRFVLSNGHASMLLYSLLHLTGYDVSIEDLKQFRQLHSKTPGHPELGYTPGVETTTGPLGQGIANAVGMAIAEKTLAATFNRSGFPVVDHFTYTFLGDGCLMEGISHEVCSLAGTLKLNKLIAFYDDNQISIDGDVQGWFTDDTAQRFEAYGWHVIRAIDGHSRPAIKAAIEQAHQQTSKPTLIICRTTIGYGSPNKAGTASSHGAPLGNDEIALTRQQLGWEYPPFEIPEEIYQPWNAIERGAEQQLRWEQALREYAKQYPELALQLNQRLSNQPTGSFSSVINEYIQHLNNNPAEIATRQASQNVLNIIGPVLPELMGGAADLAPSNLTYWSGSKPINEYPAGNYIHYGVREFGMTAIANGIALHGGFRPYTATFLMFCEYAQNAVRMAALMKLPQILIYTHDSIGLGEDGPTHQPVEQLAALRATPNLSVWRPCCQVETAVAWQQAILQQNKPTALVLSRQNLHQHSRTSEQLTCIQRGGYILRSNSQSPELLLIATGSEVTLAVEAWQVLTAQGFNVNVISMPSTDTFDKQPDEYKQQVLPNHVRQRIAIEASIDDYWRKYVGLDGLIMGMNSFGESAPAKQLFDYFGFTVEKLISMSLSLLQADK
ncbi:transketolase [Providencia rettgeri]|uniref:transketolase n=1 Tax=Providencia rettgeri TaxID=587 RepID=UPI001C83711C|nr:transketolase [Providencia rettgeri]MBX6967289.1 transketolase [Providencia rettgeri]MBX6975514.1 transketolase [Providencia rettgeri]MBX6992269.1 transketolase [Providencia rettgeri]MBX6999251.1 transketolase [Providencia rettgeri]MBX7017532.1 transketolase [Providencia rettgeri]